MEEGIEEAVEDEVDNKGGFKKGLDVGENWEYDTSEDINAEGSPNICLVFDEIFKDWNFC